MPSLSAIPKKRGDFMSEILLSQRLPILALRGINVFPNMTIHFDVGRKKSIRAVEECMRGSQEIFLVTQKDIQVDDPQQSDLYTMGTVAVVKQVLRMPGDVIRILVEGKYRAFLTECIQTEPYLFGRVEMVLDVPVSKTSNKTEALIRQAQLYYEQFLDLSGRTSPENLMAVVSSDDPGFIADYIAQNSSINFPDKQRVLEQLNPSKRLELACIFIGRELDIMQLESDIQEKVQESVNKGQRDYYLREQMRVIQTELGDDDEEQERYRYETAIGKLGVSEETSEKLLKEVRRLAKQPSNSAEAALIRTYLDTVLELPWNKRTKERVDINAARKILDNDHFGLEKVKERILEIFAVRKMTPDMPGQIICLVGPPGVGKTSIAMSIARALNRNLARLSLGGVHDEADIRGHRKTYIGSMPGRIMNAVSYAGSKNALLLLDEIDKLGSDHRGDPSSALLEVLDSEQNSTFRDHYLEVPFDLSECMFITTANTTSTIPAPLLDRMEVIELTSYTDEEKLQIAKKHLIPKQLKKHGLKRTQVRISEEAIREMIACYTRESGVRKLEREIASVCRKCDMRFVSDPSLKRIMVTGSNLEEFLGVRKFLPDELPAADSVGLVTGLAWTSVGGETLEVEVNVMEGTGKLELTGNLGDVMKESVHAAMSYIRSRTEQLHIPGDFYKTKDIHVHFPEGAIPKDGPSAGITICTAMVSALTGATVRRDVAMTGEISIRGRVLPIGGLKEKTMAALRHGIKTVIIPQANAKDLEEIDQTVRKSLNFITVSHVDTVLETVLSMPREEVAPIDCLPQETSLAVSAPEKKNRKNQIRQ